MLASKALFQRSSCLRLGQSAFRSVHAHKQAAQITAVEATSVLSSYDPYTQRHTQQRLTAAALLLAGGTALAASSAISRADCEGDAGMLHMNQLHENPKSPLGEGKGSKKTSAEQHHWTPAEVAREDFDSVIESHESEGLPVYTSDQVAENDGEEGRPIWMSYGGYVYDVTTFIQNHPGGSEKIMMAAGSSIEPFWHLYRQHFASDLPTRLMEHMVIGKLDEADQERIDEQMDALYESGDDPYASEPLRHTALKVHSDQPMNAEVPEHLLTKNFITPSSLFFVRHHHPVPSLTDEEIKDYKLEIDLSAYGKGKVGISLEQLKNMEKVEVTSTLQCSGNRRSGFNEFERTSGTTWGQGAISTAKWGGVRLADVMRVAGLNDAVDAQEKAGMEHVRFHSLDGMKSSIRIEKAMNPYGDVLICYEMNGKPLPRDHGYPLRIIVPGYAAVRNVKWINKIELSKEEAEGPWQRGLNYKILPPSVTDANDVDLSKTPSVMEMGVYSGITKIEPVDGKVTEFTPGETVMVKASGWAYSGGGRNIVRVDVTGDGARSWSTTTLKEGADQRFGRAWAWTFWEGTVPAIVQEDGTVHVYSKALDMSLNIQPETCKHNWNVRGLGNNSWFRKVAQF